MHNIPFDAMHIMSTTASVQMVKSVKYLILRESGQLCIKSKRPFGAFFFSQSCGVYIKNYSALSNVILDYCRISAFNMHFLIVLFIKIPKVYEESFMSMLQVKAPVT